MTCLGIGWSVIAARAAHLPPPEASGDEAPAEKETPNRPDPESATHAVGTEAPERNREQAPESLEDRSLERKKPATGRAPEKEGTEPCA
jgi:hypothetical protein